MLKINLKLALRNIFRNKLYTSINIIGLSVTSAFCILVYLYVKNEQSFDNFHRDSERLFRVEETDVFGSKFNKPQKNFFSFLMKDAEQINMIQTPTGLAVDLKRNFPQVENAVRLAGIGAETIRVGDQSFKEKDENLTFADADFFKVFNYPLISGNASSVLAEANTAAISERLAEKYYGKENPVGKVITMPNEPKQPPIKITGVFKNFPANSSFQFDMIMPIESDPDYKDDMARGVNSFSDPLIIKLQSGTDPVQFQRKLDAFAKNYFKPLLDDMRKDKPKDKVSDMHIILRPFDQAHYNQAAGWFHYTDLKNIFQLVCLTVVILFIACLNYILLTLTNAVSRSQDVGIRKTIGAGRLQIVLQYYTETQLLAFMSVGAGFLLSVLCLPFFATLTGTNIEMVNFSFGTIFLFLIGLGFVLGLLAGVYPSMAMSGLKPLNIMRSFSAYRINPYLSKVLVVVQFAVCVIMVISTLAIGQQMHYLSKADMGFNKDQVLIVKSPYSWLDKPKTIALRNQLAHYASTEPAIDDFTSGGSYFGGFNTNNYLINGQKTMLQDLNVDYNYFSFFKDTGHKRPHFFEGYCH